MEVSVGALHCSHVGYSSMPRFGDDRGRAFFISANEWHDAAYHNMAREIHRHLQAEAHKTGFDVHQVESSIATPKTRRVDRYLEHVGQSIGNFQQLYAHYKQERWSRWMTYRHEQKALHKLCMRVKGEGNQRAKREAVVVAYGAGRFASSMRGKRAAPVRRFLKHLRRYVVVVLVDEFRTSRVCSKCWEERWLKGGSVKVKEVEEQAEKGLVLEALVEDEDGGGNVDLERAEEEASRER